MGPRESNPDQPLTTATFHVLLALALNDMHGYGIIREVRRLSENRYQIGPGTLYDNLGKLLDRRWVEDYEEISAPEAEPRRIYRLTGEGKAALNAEVSRMRKVLRVAANRLSAKGRA